MLNTERLKISTTVEAEIQPLEERITKVSKDLLRKVDAEIAPLYDFADKGTGLHYMTTDNSPSSAGVFFYPHEKNDDSTGIEHTDEIAVKVKHIVSTESKGHSYKVLVVYHQESLRGLRSDLFLVRVSEAVIQKPGLRVGDVIIIRQCIPVQIKESDLKEEIDFFL